MTIHTLEKEKQKDFLTQNRIDPITGDLLQENDKIVICASCKSAFLVDSWEYMGGKHCNQSDTLEQIPKNEIVKLERHVFINTLDIKVASKFKSVSLAGHPYFFLSLVIGFLLYYFSIIPKLGSVIQVISSVYWVLILAFSMLSNYKDTLKIENNILYFDKNNTSNKSLKIEDIKNIEVYKAKRHVFTNLIRNLSSSKKVLYTIKVTDKHQLTFKFLVKETELEKIQTETNLLQKFNKNSIPSLSVNVEIEQLIE